MAQVQHPSQPILYCVDRTDHAKGVQKSAKGKYDCQCRQIFSARKIADPRAQRIRQQLLAGQAAPDANVVVRAGVDAVQTECAIHVAHLARLKQGQLTATNCYQVRGWFAPSTNAVKGVAPGAHIVVPNLHFERRKRRGYKVKLSDGAHKLTERSVLEKSVHYEHGQEVGQDQPGCPPRGRPQIEKLISKKDQDEEGDRKPLVAQGTRPVESRLEETSRHLTHQHEGA